VKAFALAFLIVIPQRTGGICISSAAPQHPLTIPYSLFPIPYF